jgi:hypothetical protein
MDLNGRVIYQEKLSDLTTGQPVQYVYRAGQDLTGGVYLYRLDLEEKQLTGRLIRGR